jgi:hypothetical protein
VSESGTPVSCPATPCPGVGSAGGGRPGNRLISGKVPSQACRAAALGVARRLHLGSSGRRGADSNAAARPARRRSCPKLPTRN